MEVAIVIRYEVFVNNYNNATNHNSGSPRWFGEHTTSSTRTKAYTVTDICGPIWKVAYIVSPDKWVI